MTSNFPKLQESISYLEETERKIWDYHHKDLVKDLFLLIKERTEKLKEIKVEYNHEFSHYQSIIDEILEKYSEISSLNFKNNYEKIAPLLQQILDLVERQYEQVKLSEVLIDKQLRETILNDEKIQAEQSLFTSLLEELKTLSVQQREIPTTTSNTISQTHKTTTPLEKTPSKQEEIQTILQKEDEEKTPTHEELPIEKEILGEKEVEKLTQIDSKDSIHVKEAQNELDPNKEEKQIEGIEKKPQLIKKEPKFPREEIQSTIKEYLAYQDAPELSQTELQEILEKCESSSSAKRYAEILLELKEEGTFNQTLQVGRELYAKTFGALHEYELEPLAHTQSMSWVLWDIAKQLYYLKNPSQTDESKYFLANPLTNEEKQQEIIDRHIAWVVYSQMTTSKLDHFLQKMNSSVYGKKVMDFIISKPNGQNTLPSWKLAELGKNIRLAFAQQ